VKKVVLALALGTLLAGSLSAKNLATVNGDVITSDDLQAMLSQMQGAPNYDDLSPEIKKQLLDKEIDRRLLVKAAFASGIEKDPEFKKAMQTLKGNIGLELWMRQIRDDIAVSDKDARAYYSEHKNEATYPEQVQASHILVKTEAEAKKIIKELKGSKNLATDFAEAAKTHSTGPSGPRGGDLGTFSREKMVKPFSDAAFALKSGEMTMSPVNTQFGWHIIYVANKTAGGVVPFEEVKANIAELIKNRKFKEMVEGKVEKLKKSAKVTYHK